MIYNFSCLIEKQTRVDMYLSALFTDFSRSYIQKLIDKGFVKVNWEVFKKNKKVSPRSEFQVEIIIEKTEVQAQNIPLDIAYEDENLVIVNKDAWMNTHVVPWEWWKENTLVNALLYHAKDLAWIGWVERPWIVHRLDKDTSGLIMVAKNDKMMVYLQEIIKNREVDKYYITIVDGIIKENEFTIKSEIGRDPHNRTKMTIHNPVNPKEAVTHGKLVDYIGGRFSVLKIKLETWRTHQIRVHMASIWHPIIGDQTYWNKKTNKEVFDNFWLKRQALHAYELSFDLYWKPFYIRGDIKEDMLKIYSGLK